MHKSTLTQVALLKTNEALSELLQVYRQFSEAMLLAITIGQNYD